MIVAFDCGLRASEITAMQVGSLDWDSGTFSVRGKGRKTYIRHLGDKALAAIDRYLRLRRRVLGEPSGPLWVNKRQQGLTRSGLRRMCVQRGKQAGVTGATVHRWRYSHAEALEDAGWPEAQILAEMGHSTLSVSRTYRDAAIRRGALRRHKEASPGDMLRV